MARHEIEAKTPLGRRLRDVRRTLGDDDRMIFAKKMGISKSSLAHYERGERSPDAVVLSLYRELFGVNLNWLLSGEGEIFLQGQDNIKGICGSVMLNREVMCIAIETVEEGLEGRSLKQTKKAELILIAYDFLLRDKKNKDSIIQLVRAV